jgi:hypothetical protein
METRATDPGLEIAAADSIAVESRMTSITERIFEMDPLIVQRARGEAQQLFADRRANRLQRAQLGYMLAQSYFLDDIADSACVWIQSAVERDPTNTQYQQFQRDNCTP